MAYTGPDFVNGGPPAINADNLNGMVTELERCSVLGDETENIRIGAGGKVYTSAGNAVRGQVNKLSDKIGEIVDYRPVSLTAKEDSDIFTTLGQNGYISIYHGNFNENESYTILTFDITDNTEIALAKDSGGVVGAVLYNQHLDIIPTTQSAADNYFVRGCRNDKTDSEALPTINNPWTVTEGQMIAIFYQSSMNTSFTMTYIGYEILLDNNVKFNSNQITNINEIVGASPIASEVTNIRIGADGKTYTSAGNAVRGQITDVKNSINEIIDKIPVYSTANKTSEIFTSLTQHGYLNLTHGNIQVNENYSIVTYDVEENMTFALAKVGGVSGNLVGAVLYNQHLDTIPTSQSAADNYFVKGCRSDKTDSQALPTLENPWVVTEGQMIAIFYTSVINFTMTYTDGYSTILDNNIGFNTRQISDIISITQKRPSIKYLASPDTGIAEKGKEQISVFIPSVSGYVKYCFVRVESNTDNANNWRIDRCYACDNNKNVLFPITYIGEWEMAIRISGRDDFIGGSAHGDEVFTSFHVLIDGIDISDITSITEQEFEIVRIIESTLMYDPNDAATLETRTSYTPVGIHGREYIVTNEGIRLCQYVELDSAQTLIESYMTMFPVIRGNDSISADQITDTYYANNDYIEKDVSTAEDTPAFEWQQNVTRATIFGEDSGVCATVELLKQPKLNNSGSGLFKVSNSDRYNKFYWAICGVHHVPYEASAHERFETETTYKIDVKTVS